jgi:hypothetical protein
MMDMSWKAFKIIKRKRVLLIWQVSPVHPGGQVQLNDPPPVLSLMPLVTTVVVTVQVPP